MTRGRPLEVEAELLEAFQRSGAVTEYLIAVLPKEVWRQEPPTQRGRTIAGIVAHVQSVRRGFAKMGGAQPEPLSLDRRTVTIPQARRAIQQSTEQLSRQFETALREGRARVTGMPRRAVDMLTYLIQHDAHHRGQICTLARDLGHEFSEDDIMRIWGWKTMRRKELREKKGVGRPSNAPRSSQRSRRG